MAKIILGAVRRRPTVTIRELAIPWLAQSTGSNDDRRHLPLRRGALAVDGQPDGATACNCTVCRRYGVLRAYDYEGEGIRVAGHTQAYVRGKTLAFHFCPVCGCVVCRRGRETDVAGRRRIAVNLRLAEPAAVAQIPIDRFDGRVTFGDLPRAGRRVADCWF